MIALVSIWIAETADGQVRRYRVTDLTNLGGGFVPGPDSIGTAGINNKGQVAFGFKVGEVMHAWVWLPVGEYGMTAGFHDLSVESGAPTPAIANDININGRVAGQTGGEIPGSGSATVWTLAATPTYGVVGSFTSSNGWTKAHAINDLNPPVVAGDGGATRDCECPNPFPENNDLVTRAFRVAFSGSPVLLDSFELKPDPDSVSSARDVLTPQPGGVSFAVGFTHCQQAGSLCKFGISCLTDRDPVTWNTEVRTLLAKISGGGSEVRAMNNLLETAGWGMNAASIPCVRRAVYWDNSLSPTTIGNTMPPGQTGDPSRAEGMNAAAVRQVVGWNAQYDLALLWEKTGTNWSVFDLNATIGCNSQWIIWQAYDVNDAGWIVALAQERDVQAPFLHLVLLTPKCAGDVNDNLCVDIDDLVLVITAWGNCAPVVPCPADATGNCIVDIDDLVTVITSWCANHCPLPNLCCSGCIPIDPCGGGGDSPGMPAPAGFDDGPPVSITQLIELVLESDLPSAAQAEAIAQILMHFGSQD